MCSSVCERTHVPSKIARTAILRPNFVRIKKTVSIHGMAWIISVLVYDGELNYQMANKVKKPRMYCTHLYECVAIIILAPNLCFLIVSVNGGTNY